MKKIAAVCIALILLSADASAKEDFEEPEVIRCTCYCEH